MGTTLFVPRNVSQKKEGSLRRNVIQIRMTLSLRRSFFFFLPEERRLLYSGIQGNAGDDPFRSLTEGNDGDDPFRSLTGTGNEGGKEGT